MKKRYGILFAVALMISLVLMYGTNLGIPGITQYYDKFKLLDMQFTYNYDTVVQTFQQIGIDGMAHYQTYLFVDFAFIICLWLVQAYLNSKIQQKQVKIITYVLISLRMLSDLTENIMIMIMLINQEVYTSNYVTICSAFTSLKFICLYSWAALTMSWWIRTVFHNRRKRYAEPSCIS